MEGLTSAIRDLINHPRKQGLLFEDKNKWNMLCACLDTIDDTGMAIQEYLNKDNSELYLPIYGLLQALFTQSDALKNLYFALFDEKINFKEHYPNIYEIRELRNKTIGHPTNYKRDEKNSYYVLNRSSITSTTFQYGKYEPDKELEIIDINLHEIINDYKKVLNDILEKVKKQLEEEFKAHKEKFKDEKLMSMIPNTFSYHLSKLYEFNNEIELAKLNLDTIKNVYNKINDGLVARYTDENYLPEGVKVVKEDIEFMFERIEYFFDNIDNSDNRDVVIYIDQLKLKFEELFNMLEDIDNEFCGNEKSLMVNNESLKEQSLESITVEIIKPN